MIHVSSAFDGGAITVLDSSRADEIRLALRPDASAAFSQWFHFRVSGARDTALTLQLRDVSTSSYPGGWPGYRALASCDQREWFRVDTEFDGAHLTLRHRSTTDLVWFAYFEPYPMERHAGLLARAQLRPGTRVRTLAVSCAGRPVDVVELGSEDPAAPQVWVICRQHPGETMAEWFAEGLLDRLADSADPVAVRLLRTARIHVVPNMNPDGSALGNLRTNARGVDLNRAWVNASTAASPEVHGVRQALIDQPPAVFLDVHGDESLPYVFFAGSETQPTFTAEHRASAQQFTQALASLSPDFQTVHGYGAVPFRPELLAMASQWAFDRFRCVSFTLEMPFKDNANLPDARAGWSGARSQRLGAAVVGALHSHLVR